MTTNIIKIAATALIAWTLWLTYARPKGDANPVNCPCKEQFKQSAVCTQQVPVGLTDMVAYHKDLVAPNGMTCVKMENGTVVLVEGFISVEAKKNAFIQTWQIAQNQFKRALIIEGQPTPHWIVE